MLITRAVRAISAGERLSAGTIRENIRFGRAGVTDDEIIEAAKATYVDRFVHSLPGGDDTKLDEDASNVSAGERQLITIARVRGAAVDPHPR